MPRNRITFAMFLIGVSPILWWGCGGDDDPVAPSAGSGQLLINTGVEDGSGSPMAWSTMEVGPQPGNDYVFEWSDAEAHTGSHSLMISVDAVTDQDAFGLWSQNIDTNIPHGKRLVLKAAVKTNLSGLGAGFMVRGDRASGLPVWATTEGHVSITGDRDWRIESTTMDVVPADVTNLVVFLMLYPKSTGTVYFDNIELTFQ